MNYIDYNDEVSELEIEYDLDEEYEEISSIVPTSGDALIASINHLGRVDIEYMSRISGIPKDMIIGELRGTAIFQDPFVFEGAQFWDITKGRLLRSQYICGNIPRKLEIAERMNLKFPGCFDANVDELSKLLPSQIDIDEIHVSLGAAWVPADIYALFIQELLNLRETPNVYFNKQLSTWRVESLDEMKGSVLNNYTFGTTSLSAVKIIEQTMNAKTVKVYDYNWYSQSAFERILNQPATLAAQEKQKIIIREFSQWVLRDNIRSLLEECYNSAFVGYMFSPYDGSFLQLPGLNPYVSLYPHQKNGVARILLSQSNVLLAHDVGAGKTYEIVAGVHELKRLGLSKKNLIVVPNNVLKATVDAHKLLYPYDDIFAIYPKDFGPSVRNDVLLRIQQEDHVAIYMAYSSFDMIAMSKSYWVQKKTREIKELRTAASNCSNKQEKRALESEADSRAKKLSKFLLETPESGYIPFEDLGITTLVVDEAHNYKNIPMSSKTDNIVGMHTKGSRKCAEMLEKCACVDRLIFATGTPLTNSLADLYVLQTYLQPKELKFHEIDSFDMWINCFGERETNFEIDVDSSHLLPMTRFSSFQNLTELMCLFSMVCDFHYTDEDDSSLPEFNGYSDICVHRSVAQTKYISELAERTELIRAHGIPRTEDNLLKVTTDGRKCALDIRLVDLLQYVEPTEKTKIRACAECVAGLYHRYPGTCQAVFSDIGTPKTEFNVYDALRAELTDLGVSIYEIAYVHDATTESGRAKLFQAINSGTVRVIIGSTAKLGIGVNVQEKLVALHHLSVPWRPADMVQREGRIIRRGNTCDKVFIFRYITEGSFDSYSWQLLENKQRFISSFLSGKAAVREIDDIADAVLSYAEVKALAIGNPLIKKRVETSNKLERAKIAGRQRQRQLMDLRAVIEGTPAKISKLNNLVRTVRADIALYEDSREVVPVAEREAFGEELIDAINGNALRESERVFDVYQGFSVILPANMLSDRPFVFVQSCNGGKYYLEMKKDKPLGCSKSIDYLLDHLGDREINLLA